MSISPPAMPLVDNVTAEPTRDPDTIRNQLVEQVTAMVRWRESVANMSQAGVEEFVELGGKVLSRNGQAHRARREGDQRDHRRWKRWQGDRKMFDRGMTALSNRRLRRARQRNRQGASGRARASRCREAMSTSSRISAPRSAAIMSLALQSPTARRSTSSSWLSKRLGSSTSWSTMPA